MPTDRPSPAITRVEWGSIDVAGLGRRQDVKLWPGGGRDWDWRETDTHHVPGIQPGDLAELIDHGARLVVLSRGMHLALHTTAAALASLTDRGIGYYVLETREAVRMYNGLVEQGFAVGGLFHTTC